MSSPALYMIYENICILVLPTKNPQHWKIRIFLYRTKIKRVYIINTIRNIRIFLYMAKKKITQQHCQKYEYLCIERVKTSLYHRHYMKYKNISLQIEDKTILYNSTIWNTNISIRNNIIYARDTVGLIIITMWTDQRSNEKWYILIRTLCTVDSNLWSWTLSLAH